MVFAPVVGVPWWSAGWGGSVRVAADDTGGATAGAVVGLVGGVLVTAASGDGGDDGQVGGGGGVHGWNSTGRYIPRQLVGLYRCLPGRPPAPVPAGPPRPLPSTACRSSRTYPVR